jgi:hypothetical protein
MAGFLPSSAPRPWEAEQPAAAATERHRPGRRRGPPNLSHVQQPHARAPCEQHDDDGGTCDRESELVRGSGRALSRPTPLPASGRAAEVRMRPAL